MYTRIRNGLLTEEFLAGLETFIQFATSQHRWMDGERIKCPCNQRKCQNTKFLDVPTVKFHLAKYGFVSDYYVWRFHGECNLRVDVEQDVGAPSQMTSEESSNAYHAYNGYECCWKKYKHDMMLQRKRWKGTKASSFINDNSCSSSATSQFHQDTMKEMFDTMRVEMEAQMEAKLQAERTQMQAQIASLMDEFRRNGIIPTTSTPQPPTTEGHSVNSNDEDLGDD
nr:uncharacterized protein LOC109168299 [Ipomoea batatas]